MNRFFLIRNTVLMKKTLIIKIMTSTAGSAYLHGHPEAAEDPGVQPEDVHAHLHAEPLLVRPVQLPPHLLLLHLRLCADVLLHALLPAGGLQEPQVRLLHVLHHDAQQVQLLPALGRINFFHPHEMTVIKCSFPTLL